jgi:osmotically-inducible protein OsmY
MNRKQSRSISLFSLATVLLASSLAGCAPLIVGTAAVGTALVVTDRRSSGAQVDDETIEVRAGMRLKDALGDRVHINVSSYNRQVLLTGEAPTEAMKQQAEQVVSRVENVKGVVNEIGVMAPTSLTQRSNDTLITGKVRASFVDASDLQTSAFRVVTERGNVYLMGRVSAREADRATAIARQISGVQRVVRIFEVLSPEELRAAGIVPAGGTAPVSTPAPVTVAPATVAPTAAPAAGAPQPAASPSEPAGIVTTPVR